MGLRGLGAQSLCCGGVLLGGAKFVLWRGVVGGTKFVLWRGVVGGLQSLYSAVLQLVHALHAQAVGLRPMKTAIDKSVCKQPVCLWLFSHCSL